MSRGDDRPSDIETDEGFVQRWSRRKRDAQQPPELAPPPETEPADPEPEPESATAQPEPPSDEDMPPLDSLGPNSDIGEFFSPRVSEGLRQAALQRIFRQPKFNYQDGLDVYCGDYRHFKPLGDIVTAAMRHRLEVARERVARLTEEADGAVDERSDDPATLQAAQQSTDTADDPEDQSGNA